MANVASKSFTARAKFFGGEGVTTKKVKVDADGAVRVWDSVAGHYTLCHSLSAAAAKRIAKLAEVAS
jgi:hypothetical protein